MIGAGPAGLMAALVAGRAGARVVLADEDFRPGGRLLAERIEVGGQDGADWAAAVWAELAAMPNVRLMPRTTVTGAYDGGTYGALERVGEHLAAAPADLPRACFWRIAARRAVLCAGASERLIAFPGNDRPGVMLAGAVRAYANRWAVAPRRAAVFTACDDGWRTAADLAAAGVEVAAIVDARGDAAPPAGPWRVLAGAEVVGTRGRARPARDRGAARGAVERIAVDCLAVSGGWNPAVQLSCHLGARPVWDARRRRPSCRRRGRCRGWRSPGRRRGPSRRRRRCGRGRRRRPRRSGSRCRRCRRRRIGRERRRPSGSSRRRGGPGWICRTT